VSRPNVLLIMTDQQNLNTLRCYGNRVIETPAIDSLAERGVQFENTYVAIPLCMPNRASIWTSMYPHSNGVMFNDDGREVSLPPSLDTIGDVAKGSGYRCGYIGKWHVGNEKTPQHGFTDAWWTHLRGSYEQELEERAAFSFASIEAASKLEERLKQRGQVPFEQAHDTVVTDRAIEFMRTHRSEPFFAVCSMRAPHDPYTGPFNDYYDPADVLLPPSLAETFKSKPVLQQKGVPRDWFRELAGEREGEFDEFRLRQSIARYWGMVRLIDLNVGRLLQALDELQIRRNTIVVFMSDHGDMMGAHRLMSKGNFMYEEAVRVPFILSWPGVIPESIKVTELASTIDVIPTLLELMSLPQPNAMQGRSLRQSWDYGFNKRDAVFMEMFESYGLFNPVFSVRTERWKYNWYLADMDELYDLETDPYELENLALDRRHGDTLLGLRSRIRNWLTETGDIRLSDLAMTTKSFQADF
jgi:arylsulfatase A-like enzyme